MDDILFYTRALRCPAQCILVISDHRQYGPVKGPQNVALTVFGVFIISYLGDN